MGLILNIETATRVCSVALAKDGIVLDVKESTEEKSHAALLAVFIDQILKERQLTAGQLDAIAVSKGPGSYTGLRIGVSTAKGLCYGANIPLVAVTTLRVMAKGALEPDLLKNQSKNENVILCPMIDARRMEVYTALFDTQLNMIHPIEAKIIDKDSFHEILQNNRIVFFGSGAAKCRETIVHENAVFSDQPEPSASYMAELTEEAFREKKFEDVAYFEPFYLKDFIATVPKKNILLK